MAGVSLSYPANDEKYFLKARVMVNIMTLNITMVAPAGKSKKKEMVIPAKTEITATEIAISIAALKPFAI